MQQGEPEAKAGAQYDELDHKYRECHQRQARPYAVPETGDDEEEPRDEKFDRADGDCHEWHDEPRKIRLSNDLEMDHEGLCRFRYAAREEVPRDHAAQDDKWIGRRGRLLEARDQPKGEADDEHHHERLEEDPRHAEKRLTEPDDEVAANHEAGDLTVRVEIPKVFAPRRYRAVDDQRRPPCPKAFGHESTVSCHRLSPDAVCPDAITESAASRLAHADHCGSWRLAGRR